MLAIPRTLLLIPTNLCGVLILCGSKSPQLSVACGLNGLPSLSEMHLTLLLELAEAIEGVVPPEKNIPSTMSNPVEPPG